MTYNNTIKKVLCIIVTYNASDWLNTCISSVVNSDYPVDLAVVDNASTDGTADLIKNQYLDSISYFYPLNENLGFGKAHNFVFHECDLTEYDYVFLLNQDAEISRSGISELVQVAEGDGTLGILSPIHYYSEGVMDRSFAGYYDRTLGERTKINGINVRMVDFVNAAIWLVRADLIIKLDGFNPLFQHYGEDTNFVHKLHAAGYRVGIVESTAGFHYRNQEATGLDRRSFADMFYLKRLIRLLNPSLYFLKEIIVLLGAAANHIFLYLINNELGEAKNILNGLVKLLKQLAVIYHYRKLT
ncbi:glycosyltransferase family 2 protein [Neolewinella aurantiaca]|uniref:Glycosyltransferase family 2 protein n=1 Tax=Neolewinella aurantiaca TaxID=2602767 RepID=A0A5C7FWY3_9BACT|nr:glycosyltransferase family 2 protein [Neolewinella aurantiaca]TXF90950.1 glycosyltransferase family 2 protein [Neolewinella aurantiaca]